MPPSIVRLVHYRSKQQFIPSIIVFLNSKYHEILPDYVSTIHRLAKEETLRVQRNTRK